jgi:hypothetical protein
VSTLSPSELEVIRRQPQQTKLFLSVFRPRTIFKARVNNALAQRGDRFIAFDTVTLGSYTDIQADSLLLIGTTDGARDIGTVRIRSASSIELLVAENSDIRWQDDLFLTALRFWRIEAKYPKITHDPLNAESVLFWKDYDIAYSNQNSVLGTFVNAGEHRAIFRDCASGIAESYWSSTGTHNLLSGTLNYNWQFEGGTPSSSSSAHPGTVTYSAPGHYVTSLSISGSNGSVDTTYRYVSVYDYLGCGTGTPPTNWELNSLDGSRGEGGYSASITLHEVIDINEGDVVVIFAENWYGDEKRSLGGNHPNSSNIIFSGYILDDSIRINYRNSTVEFQAGSISALMKQSEGFSCSVESKAVPTTWFELLDMDIRRATYHYLRWHTTVLNLTDIEFKGTDRKIQFFDADRGSIYDAIDSLIRSALVGEVVSDKQSKLWLEVSAYATPNATGTYTPVMEISKRDWMGEPRIDEALSNTTSFIEMGGIAYSGSATGTFAPLLANAPGNAPSYRGRVERTQGLALVTQSQLNQLSGDVLAFKNAKYPVIDMDLTGNYNNLDIAPQEAVQIDIDDSMRGRRINAPYIPSAIQWSFDPENNILLPKVTWSIITSGEAGESIIIPDTPPAEGFNNTPSGHFTSPTFPVGFSFPIPLPGAVAVIATDNPIHAQSASTYSGNAGIDVSETYDPYNLVTVTPTQFSVNVSGFYSIGFAVSIQCIVGGSTAVLTFEINPTGNSTTYGSFDPLVRMVHPVTTSLNTTVIASRIVYISSAATISLPYAFVTGGGGSQGGFSGATVTLQLIASLV